MLKLICICVDLFSASWKKLLICMVVLLFTGSCTYGCIGTSTRVEEIKQRAIVEIPKRGWEIMRYEGYQLGSFNHHGGEVWYHVRNIDNHSIQYRVMVTLWGGELHYTYGEPEKLNRFNIDRLIPLQN